MHQWMDAMPVGWVILKTINLCPPFSFLKLLLNSGFANSTLEDEEKLIVIPVIGNDEKVEDMQHMSYSIWF